MSLHSDQQKGVQFLADTFADLLPVTGVQIPRSLGALHLKSIATAVAPDLLISYGASAAREVSLAMSRDRQSRRSATDEDMLPGLKT